MTDDLRKRLAELDPMHSGVPTKPTTSASSRELLENIMSTPTKERVDGGTAPRRTWTIAVAAVAALVLAIAGSLALTGDGEPVTTIAGGPALELNAGADDPMAMCIVFSAEELERTAEIAFGGTVTSVDGSRVTLTVDSWFRGGDEPSSVVLNAPQGMEALIGGIPFEVGGQYLISARDGNVNYCGFSGPATPELQSAFDEAFTQG